MVDCPQLAPESDISSSSAMWVVFSDDTDIRFLKMLKKGYRHCFIIMMQGERWILIDPRADKTDIRLLPHPVSFNFPRYFIQQGKTVIKARGIETPSKIMPVFPCSCVETVKRVLGIHRRWVITPYQLYKSLIKIQTKG